MGTGAGTVKTKGTTPSFGKVKGPNKLIAKKTLAARDGRSKSALSEGKSSARPATNQPNVDSQRRESVAPATFRCNRKRMLLLIRVALHHVHPKQVSLNTTKTRIELRTSGRRVYRLARDYPNGIECDDEQTVAKMNGNVLEIQLPITKLPHIKGGPTVAPPAAEPSESTTPIAPSKKRKKGAAPDAQTNAKQAPAAAAVSGPTDESDEPVAASLKARKVAKTTAKKSAAKAAAAAPPSAAPAAAAAAENGEKRAKVKKGKKKATARDSPPDSTADVEMDEAPGPAPTDDLMALVEQAAETQEAKQAKSLAKMRQFEDAVAQREQKLQERKEAKEARRQALLTVAATQKKAIKSAKAAAAATTKKSSKPLQKKARSVKHVTFNPVVEESA